MTGSGDAGAGESLNLPSLPSALQIPESSDENIDKKAPPNSEFVSSLNKMVNKELRDLSKSLPGGNLGNFKLIDEAGGDITVSDEVEKSSQRPHKKRSLPNASEREESRKKTRSKREPGLQRKTWDQRAACVFAYLHPRIGHKDYHLTSELCKISANTLRGWTSKALLIAKWVPFLDKMTAADASRIVDLDLDFLGVNPTDTVNASEFKELLIRKNLTPVIIKEGKKRVQSRPRVSKWHPQFLFVKKILEDHWDNGRPVTLKVVRDLLQAEFQVTPSAIESIPMPNSLKIPDVASSEGQKVPSKNKNMLKKFSDRYLAVDGKSFPTLVNTFITRAINRSGFSLRDKFLKRLLPFDWKTEFPALSARFLSYCRDFGAENIVAISTAFIPTSIQPELLAGDMNYDPSPGIISLISVTLPERKLLKPLLVKPGVELDDTGNSNVITCSSPNGSLTSQHVVFYIKSILSDLGRNKTIVLLNESTQFKGEEINTLLSTENNLRIFYIPNSLDTVASVVSSHLYPELDHRLKASLEASLDSASMLSTEQKFKDRLYAVEKLYRSADSSNDFKVLVEKCFSKAGLNPYVPEGVLNNQVRLTMKQTTQAEQSFMKIEKNEPQLPKAVDILQLNLP